MVRSAEEFVLWNDFPKGLKVLLLEKDESSALETTSKLEEMDYKGKILSYMLLFFYFLF